MTINSKDAGAVGTAEVFMPSGASSLVAWLDYDGKRYAKRADVVELAGFTRSTQQFIGVTQSDSLDVVTGKHFLPVKYWGEKTLRDFMTAPPGARRSHTRRTAARVVLEQVFNVDSAVPVQETLPDFRTLNVPEEKIIQRTLDTFDLDALEQGIIEHVAAALNAADLEEKIIQRAFDTFSGNELEEKIYMRVMNRLRAGLFKDSY